MESASVLTLFEVVRHLLPQQWVFCQQILVLNQFAIIKWRVCQGLRWLGLLPLLFELGKGAQPHVLVVHLGSNDFGLMKGKALVIRARKDMQLIWRHWPGASVAGLG